MGRLVLYPFRYRDETTGKWVKARYLAELRDIEARHAQWETTGPPEVRELAPKRYFDPYPLVSHADVMRLSERQPEINPHLERPPAIDAAERFLVTTFLRRYVTYCARRRRFDAMQGAARLCRELLCEARPA